MSKTVQENITFGLPYDKEKFEKVIDVCQLRNDIEKQFSNGKDTIIGERGVNVSGGQKARISLARACYSDAQILLLDDPLSAVDPHVANELFTKCFKQFCKEKIVILVTHQLQFLKEERKILVLENGVQKMLGSYKEIIDQGFNIEAILQQFNQAEEEAKVVEEPLEKDLKKIKVIRKNNSDDFFKILEDETSDAKIGPKTITKHKSSSFGSNKVIPTEETNETLLTMSKREET